MFTKQQFVMIHVNRKRKGKTLKLLLVWEVPLSHMWKVLPEYGGQFYMWGVPIQKECTA